jgi:hypothetical protein
MFNATAATTEEIMSGRPQTALNVCCGCGGGIIQSRTNDLDEDMLDRVFVQLAPLDHPTREIELLQLDPNIKLIIIERLRAYDDEIAKGMISLGLTTTQASILDVGLPDGVANTKGKSANNHMMIWLIAIGGCFFLIGLIIVICMRRSAPLERYDCETDEHGKPIFTKATSFWDAEFSNHPVTSPSQLTSPRSPQFGEFGYDKHSTDRSESLFGANKANKTKNMNHMLNIAGIRDLPSGRSASVYSQANTPVETDALSPSNMGKRKDRRTTQFSPTELLYRSPSGFGQSLSNPPAYSQPTDELDVYSQAKPQRGSKYKVVSPERGEFVGGEGMYCQAGPTGEMEARESMYSIAGVGEGNRSQAPARARLESLYNIGGSGGSVMYPGQDTIYSVASTSSAAESIMVPSIYNTAAAGDMPSGSKQYSHAFNNHDVQPVVYDVSNFSNTFSKPVEMAGVRRTSEWEVRCGARTPPNYQAAAAAAEDGGDVASEIYADPDAVQPYEADDDNADADDDDDESMYASVETNTLKRERRELEKTVPPLNLPPAPPPPRKSTVDKLAFSPKPLTSTPPQSFLGAIMSPTRGRRNTALSPIMSPGSPAPNTRRMTSFPDIVSPEPFYRANYEPAPDGEDATYASIPQSSPVPSSPVYSDCHTDIMQNEVLYDALELESRGGTGTTSTTTDGESVIFTLGGFGDVGDQEYGTLVDGDENDETLTVASGSTGVYDLDTFPEDVELFHLPVSLQRRLAAQELGLDNEDNASET